MSPSDRLLRPPRTAVLGYVTLTVAAALVVLRQAAPASLGPDFWFWLAAGVLAESLWLRLPLGGATLSMASAVVLATVLTLPPGDAIVATAVATLVGELVVMRKPLLRAVFNASQTAVAVGAAAWGFARVGAWRSAGASAEGLDPVAVLAAAALFYVVNRAAVTGMIALHERVAVWTAWRTSFQHRAEVVTTLAAFGLGALAGGLYAATGPVRAIAPALIFAGLWLLCRWAQTRHAELAARLARARAVPDAPPSADERAPRRRAS